MSKLLSFSFGNFTKRQFSISQKRFAKVTLLEPNNPLGQNISLLLKQSNFISELNLHFNSSGSGMIADLSDINTNVKVNELTGLRDSFKAFHNTNMVVVAGPNLPCQDFQTPESLFEANKPYMDLALDLILGNELKPLIIFAVEPMELTLYYFKKLLDRSDRFFPEQFLGVFSTRSTLVNSIVHKITNRVPHVLNCHVCGGISTANIYPLIEETCLYGILNKIRVTATNHQIIQKMLEFESSLLTKSAPGPVMLYAHSISSYINSICHAIDTDTFTTLSTAYFTDHKYDLHSCGHFISFPLVIDKNGMRAANYDFLTVLKRICYTYKVAEETELTRWKSIEKYLPKNE